MPRPRTCSHQGAEALGPDRRVDVPVAEAAGVVAPAQEPAVVEDEALHADGGGAVGDRGQPLEVVVEVDRLPDVEHHRLGGWMRRQAALVGVQCRREPVEPVARRDHVHPRGRVALARAEPDLAGQQQLAAADGGAGRGVALDAEHRVAAPGDVHAEHLAVRRGEAGGAEHGERCGPQARPSGAGLPEPETVGDRVPLGGSLVLVATGEVEHLDEVVRGGYDDLETLEQVVVGTVVGQPVAQPQRAAGQRLRLEEQARGPPRRRPARCAAGRRPARSRCRRTSSTSRARRCDDHAGAAGCSGRASAPRAAAAQGPGGAAGRRRCRRGEQS